jgi:hypothetical protein
MGNWYSLDCSYYTKEFSTKEFPMEKLLENIVATGMDPNYEIVMNGKLTGLTAAEALVVTE